MAWRDDVPDDTHEQDEALDPEGPDESEMDAEDEAGTIACPYCRKEIAEEAEWCPKCGKYISTEDSPLRLSPWHVVVIVLLTVMCFWWLFVK